MITSLFTESVQKTLREVWAYYVGEVFDDASDMDAERIKELIEAGKFLGLDFWDRSTIEILGNYCPTDYGYDRVKKIFEGGDAKL
jgi:hypothetical protein